MHGPSSLLASVTLLSLTAAAPANDHHAVATITKSACVEGVRSNSKAAAAATAALNNAQVFKENPAPSPTPEQKSPSPEPSPPAPTTTSEHALAPESFVPTVHPGGGTGDANPSLLTIQVTNKMNVAIHTQPSSNAEAVGIQGARFPGPGSLIPGSQGEMIVPMDWAGRIAVLKDGQPMQGVESLIEASFKPNGVAIDVSYVQVSVFTVS